MTNKAKILGVVALAIFLSARAGAQSVPVGTQAFIDFGTPMADGSPTGNINTATAFVIGDLTSDNNNTGVFSGMASQSFGPISLNTTNPNSVMFGNGVFGHFASTALVEDNATLPGFLNLVFKGNWTPGSQGGVTGGPFSAEMSITFTQSPAGAGGTISDSAVFETPAPSSAVPEPSSLGMLLAGLAGVVVSDLLRRRRRPVAFA